MTTRFKLRLDGLEQAIQPGGWFSTYAGSSWTRSRLTRPRTALRRAASSSSAGTSPPASRARLRFGFKPQNCDLCPLRVRGWRDGA